MSPPDDDDRDVADVFEELATGLADFLDDDDEQREHEAQLLRRAPDEVANTLYGASFDLEMSGERPRDEAAEYRSGPREFLEINELRDRYPSALQAQDIVRQGEAIRRDMEARVSGFTTEILDRTVRTVRESLPEGGIQVFESPWPEMPRRWGVFQSPEILIPACWWPKFRDWARSGALFMVEGSQGGSRSTHALNIAGILVRVSNFLPRTKGVLLERGRGVTLLDLGDPDDAVEDVLGGGSDEQNR